MYIQVFIFPIIQLFDAIKMEWNFMTDNEIESSSVRAGTDSGWHQQNKMAVISSLLLYSGRTWKLLSISYILYLMTWKRETFLLFYSKYRCSFMFSRLSIEVKHTHVYTLTCRPDICIIFLLTFNGVEIHSNIMWKYSSIVQIPVWLWHLVI